MSINYEMMVQGLLKQCHGKYALSSMLKAVQQTVNRYIFFVTSHLLGKERSVIVHSINNTLGIIII